MICPNIIVITSDFPEFDDEINQAMTFLEDQYKATRSVTVYEFDGDVFTKRGEGKDTPGEGSSDTGVYLIAHGSSEKGFYHPLSKQAHAKAFVGALLSLADRGFSIRKVCSLICCGVQMTGGKLNRGKVESAPTSVPEESAVVQHIFVQHLCQAIAELDKSRKLNGLMIAGHSSPVFLTKNANRNDRPVKTFQAGKVDFSMRPESPKKLKNYTSRKLIFVWESGKWRFGKLSEYTDKTEWKAALAKENL